MTQSAVCRASISCICIGWAKHALACPRQGLKVTRRAISTSRAVRAGSGSSRRTRLARLREIGADNKARFAGKTGDACVAENLTREFVVGSSWTGCRERHAIYGTVTEGARSRAVSKGMGPSDRCTGPVNGGRCCTLTNKGSMTLPQQPCGSLARPPSLSARPRTSADAHISPLHTHTKLLTILINTLCKPTMNLNP